ncbi:restriction endonuclease subunit S [Pseudoalteromonas sp. CH_XMU1449-3]|uniref:restriction endonuclease subunit S n=1 Tax=Pseudoalteromonas sp. CH_XMU1449-3 TaxID=3107774 RepID=UPI003009776B
MSKLSQRAKPNLRFKGFGEYWNIERLGDYLSFKNGINADKESYGKGYKFINVLDIINNNFITHESIIGSVDVDEKVFERNEVAYGDILFQRSSENREEAGQSNVYLDPDKTSCFGGFVIRGKAKKAYNPVYLNYLLKSYLARKEIVTKSGGSTRYNVGQDTLSEVKIYISSNHDEQQKIANFLSSVDKKISLLKEKNTLLTQYKKGVMQKLFKQEIRFKDDNGNDFPDWQDEKLGKWLEEYKAKSTEENQFEVLTSSRTGLMKQSDYYGEGRITERSNIGFNIIPSGYLTFRSRSDDRQFFFNLNELDYTGIISTYYPVFKMKNDQNKFFIELSRFHKNRFGRQAVGTSQVVLSFNELKNIKFAMPCTEEQAKIAEFAGALDKKLAAVHQQIELTQTFKKGLLQQMFV